MLKRFASISLIIIISSCQMYLPSNIKAQTNLLIRCDDIGMCHSVNLAVKKLIEEGFPFSTSVMFACPWYKEAVEILKDNPQISVGVHLTLNSEWRNYKWGPILGKLVPSLSDSNGYFYESEEEFKNSDYKLDEVEKELRAQIERGINSGLKIDYVDHHIGTAASTPELTALVEKLADEYKLGISRYFDENYETLWDVAPEKKMSTLIVIINNLKKDATNLAVIHIGIDTPEMQGLIDMNYPEDPYRVSVHRQAELEALCSQAFSKAVQKNNVNFITYRELIKKVGLKDMKRVRNVYEK